MDAQVRNIIKFQVVALLRRGKEALRDYGRQKLLEIQEKIPTADSIKSDLETDINASSCSDRGQAKFEKKVQTIEDVLTSLLDIVNGALEVINKWVDKIEPLTLDVEPCTEENEGDFNAISQPAGALGKIQQTICALNPWLEILKQIIALSPLLLVVFQGMFSSAPAEDAIISKREKTKRQILFYTQIALAVPPMIEYYIQLALQTFEQLVNLRDRVQSYKDQILTMAVYVQNLKMNYITECNIFLAEQEDSDTFTGINDDFEQEEFDTDQYDGDDVSFGGGDPIKGFPTYSDAVGWYNQQYEDTVNLLLSQNSLQAVERTVKLDEEFREKYNIRHHNITINWNQSQGTT